MRDTMLKSLTKITAVSALSLVSSVALAGPLFTTLEYAITSGFTSFTAEGGTAGVVVGSDTVALAAGGTGDQTLSWGTPAGGQNSQSQVGVRDGAPGSITINGAAVTTGAVFHNNAPINGLALDFAELTTDLVLGLDLDGGFPGSVFTPQRIIVDVDFDETSNRVACQLGGAPLGSGPGAVGCDDIFTLDLIGAGFNAAGQIIAPLPLPDPDFMYLAILTVQDVDQLTDFECGVAGADNGCFGLITAERTNENKIVTLQIITQKIPAPATLALLGLGLLGFGARGMRRRAS